MNPKPNIPETLLSRWKPRKPSAAIGARLFGRTAGAHEYSLMTFLRWMVPATACLFALCVSIVDFTPGAASPLPAADGDMREGEIGVPDYIERCLSDRSTSHASGNNRLAQISGSILEWTKTSPSNSTKGFLLQSITNSAMF